MESLTRSVVEEVKSPNGRHCDCYEGKHLFYERIGIKLDSGIDLAVAMRQAEEELLNPERKQEELWK